MDEKAEQLRLRTKKFALRILNMTDSLSNSPKAWVLGKQILRSGTSIGANYRAATRAKSRPDLLRSLALLWKKPTKPSTGWNYSPIRN